MRCLLALSHEQNYLYYQQNSSGDFCIQRSWLVCAPTGQRTWFLTPVPGATVSSRIMTMLGRLPAPHLILDWRFFYQIFAIISPIAFGPTLVFPNSNHLFYCAILSHRHLSSCHTIKESYIQF